MASRRGTIVGWCVQDYRVLSSSADQPSPASPSSAVAIEQPLVFAETVVSTPSATLSHARDLREIVMLTEDSPNVELAENTVTLEFNAAERDLERGPSPIESDGDGDT